MRSFAAIAPIKVPCGIDTIEMMRIQLFSGLRSNLSERQVNVATG